MKVICAPLVVGCFFVLQSAAFGQRVDGGGVHPPDMVNFITGLQNGGSRIQSVQFDDSDLWIVIHDNGIQTNRPLPGPMQDYLAGLRAAGTKPTCITHTPNAGWAVVANGGVKIVGGPPAMHNFLGQVAANQDRVLSITFNRQGAWLVLLTNGNGRSGGPIPPGLNAHMQQFGARVISAGLDSSNRWVTVTK